MRLIEIDPKTKSPDTQYRLPQKPVAPRAPRPKSTPTLPIIKPIKPLPPTEALIAALKQQIADIKKRIAALQANARNQKAVQRLSERRSH